MRGGLNLIMNHFIAMFLKKFLSTIRSWVLFIIQIIIPSLFITIAIVINRSQKRTGNLPAMPLDLSKFSSPVTIVRNGVQESNNTYHDNYKSIVSQFGSDVIDGIANMSEKMINLVSISGSISGSK